MSFETKMFIAATTVAVVMIITLTYTCHDRREYRYKMAQIGYEEVQAYGNQDTLYKKVK